MNIEALKEAAGKALPGEWQTTGATYVYSREGSVCVCGEPAETTIVSYIPTEPWKPGFDQACANAAYIALANPSTILSLIASHEALAKALRAAREWVELGPELPGVSLEDEADARTTLAMIDAALQSIQPVEEKQS